MIYRFADCVLDTGRRELRRAGQVVPLEPQVFDILELSVVPVPANPQALAVAKPLGIPAIAAMPGVSPERLRAAMNPSHGRMPDLSLGKRDQDDLAVYILSLRPK
jgi:hypothetical protein